MKWHKEPSVARRTIRDDDGVAVVPGCKIRFSFGIPGVGVSADVIERDGKLIALTPAHNPKEATVAYIRQWFNFWVIR